MLVSNSSFLAQAMTLTQFCVSLLGVNHLYACVWVHMGSDEGDSWIRVLLEQSQDTHEAYVYFSAMHWSLSQFHGSMEVHPVNFSERVYALVILMCGCVSFPFFISSITDYLIRLRETYKDLNQNRSILNNLFMQHVISPDIC